MTSLPHPVTGELFNSPVAPGHGWPTEPAHPRTPVALRARDVHMRAAKLDLHELTAQISVCRACTRLVSWREEIARDKRAAFAAQPYWGRPVPGWGAEQPGLLIMGLAPAAHGGNRTGRIFSGDRSGDWLFAALHRAGFASQAVSEHAGDGQELVDARMVAAVRCAPPDNLPTTEERDTCLPWLRRELELTLPAVRVIVCLGGFAWDATLRGLGQVGVAIPKPKPRFGHGARFQFTVPDTVDGPGADPEPVTVLGCYHPSQRNTFTGRLTAPMLDEVFSLARHLVGR